MSIKIRVSKLEHQKYQVSPLQSLGIRPGGKASPEVCVGGLGSSSFLALSFLTVFNISALSFQRSDPTQCRLGLGLFELNVGQSEKGLSILLTYLKFYKVFVGSCLMH